MRKTLKYILIVFILLSLTGCGKKEFTVTFKDGDNELLSVKVKKGATAIQTSAPDKEYEIFDYWELDDQPFDFSTPITENTSLQAVYKSVYIVTFVVNEEATKIKVNPNETIELPTINSTNESFFTGWYLDNQLFDESTPITSNITLVAHFQDFTPCIAVEFTQSQITIGTKQTATLPFVLTPSNTTDKIKFTSSNPDIVSVSNKGIIKGLKIGQSTITASINDLQANIIVNVLADVETIDVESVVTLTANQTHQLNPTIFPSDSLNKTLTYKSSNNEIVTVSDSGLLTAIQGGTATIEISAVNGTKKTITVNVNQDVLSLIVNDQTGIETLYFFNDPTKCSYNITLETINWKDGKGETKTIPITDSNVHYSTTLNLLKINDGKLIMNGEVSSQSKDVLTITYGDQSCSIDLVLEPKLKIKPVSSNTTYDGNDIYITNANVITIIEANVFGTFSVQTDVVMRIANFESTYRSCKFRYITINATDDAIIIFTSKAGQNASIYLHNAK